MTFPDLLSCFPTSVLGPPGFVHSLLLFSSRTPVFIRITALVSKSFLPTSFSQSFRVGCLLLLPSCPCPASNHSVMPKGLLTAPHATGPVTLASLCRKHLSPLHTVQRSGFSKAPTLHACVLSHDTSVLCLTPHNSPESSGLSSHPPPRELPTWLAPVPTTQGLPQGQCSAHPMAMAGFHAGLPWETLNSQGKPESRQMGCNSSEAAPSASHLTAEPHYPMASRMWDSHLRPDEKEGT